jgi:hypothetical protein
VRVLHNLRNDGTFPGLALGKLLVRRDSMGFIRDIGTFLQNQIIYFTVDRMVDDYLRLYRQIIDQSPGASRPC